MTETTSRLVVVVPAAGVGKRMQANCPKQYLTINNKAVIEHTVERLLSHPAIDHIVIALGKDDEYFGDLAIAQSSKVRTVVGGAERVDSVLAGLKTIDAKRFPWALVHDAARPCLPLADLNSLINSCLNKNEGAILAYPVKDTMKRTSSIGTIEHTVDRDNLWHALTPQMYKTNELIEAIESGLAGSVDITDESSAIEAHGIASHVVSASPNNIKITQPEDLAFAKFILAQQLENT